jgi:hypothetical protein
MKVLWFSHIPVLPEEFGNSGYKGGTWISTLQKQICSNEDTAVTIPDKVGHTFRSKVGQ